MSTSKLGLVLHACGPSHAEGGWWRRRARGRGEEEGEKRETLLKNN
jgi:hypothetical protein